MKTKEEIKEEIIELYGATQALSEAMNFLHAQRMEKSKQMMALNHMLKEMEDKDDCVGWFGYDTGVGAWFETNKGDDGAIPLYKNALEMANRALETKDATVQVSPFEFVEMVMEKEHLIGQPIFWAQWPNEEKK